MLTFFAPIPLFAQIDFVGKTEAEIFAVKGQPQSKAKTGNKAIYRWVDAQVVVIDGRITEYRARNSDKEYEMRSYYIARATEEQRRVAQEKARTQKETEAAVARSEEGRIFRERQLEAQRASSSNYWFTSGFYVKDGMGGRHPSLNKPLPPSTQKQPTRSISRNIPVSPPPNRDRQSEIDLLNIQIENLRSEISRLQRIETEAYMAHDEQTRANYRQAIQGKQRELDLLKEKKQRVFFGK
ncbi:MAG: hypothetical protein HYV96_10525 [Opitutae bacterium]|nr:hypothetical protein [Opitutae bacterium]